MSKEGRAMISTNAMVQYSMARTGTRFSRHSLLLALSEWYMENTVTAKAATTMSMARPITMSMNESNVGLLIC